MRRAKQKHPRTETHAEEKHDYMVNREHLKRNSYNDRLRACFEN
jgi:hypothetical protein